MALISLYHQYGWYLTHVVYLPSLRREKKKHHPVTFNDVTQQEIGSQIVSQTTE